jgi:hypothetical protein
MRLTCLCIIVLLFASLAIGQIPNAGFEAWVADPDSNYNPVGWETTNSFPLISVEPVTPGCEGSFAMRVKTINAGIPLPGVAKLQTANSFTKAPTTFTACVKSTIMPGDHAYLIVGLMKGDSIIAATGNCTFHIDSTISQFTTMVFPIALQSSLVPDSLLVIVASGLGTGKVGTEIIVDNIAFTGGGATEVAAAGPLVNSFELSQNYPNPFNPTTVVSWQLPVVSNVKLVVYDLLGREVATLVNEVQQPGSHQVSWDAAGMVSGTYFYRLTAGSFMTTKRLIVLR